MLMVQRTFPVNRPVEAVFDYLTDFTNAEHWDPGTVTCSQTTPGAIGVGTHFHNVSQFRGRKTELDYVLKTLERGSRLVFVGTNKTVTSTDDMTFAPTAGGVSITYTARFEFHGLARLAEPFLKKTFNTIADETVTTMTATLSTV